MITRLVVVIALLAGCGAKSGSGSVDYSVSAQKNYDKGMKELKQQN